MELYDLEDLEIDEKTKLLAKNLMEIEEEYSKSMCPQLAKMITLYYILEKEIELEISFLEGRIYTLISNLSRLKVQCGEMKMNKYDEMILDCTNPLVEEMSEKLRILKNRRGLLWAECNRKCFPDNFEE